MSMRKAKCKMSIAEVRMCVAEKRQEAETDYVYDVYYEANEALDSEDEDKYD